MDIKKVAVVGGGTMGNGIVHVFAMNGFDVTLVEIKKEFAERALALIDKNLGRMVSRDKISEAHKKATLERISTSLDMEQTASTADLIVEAVNETFDLKKKIFFTLDQHASGKAILASNTSSISITRLAGITKRPEKVIGMHFFNPVPVMKLVEVVRGLDTSDETYKMIEATAKKLDKVPVPVNDSPGFVSNRVLMPMINEAAFSVYEGVATPENVDEVMKLGMAHPMGPLRLADFIGLDVCLDILNVLYTEFRDPKYRPCPLLVKMVDAGKLGDKTGEGFYKH